MAGQMKKVLLIDPPGTVGGLNSGLAYLAGTLKRAGHSVFVLDFNNDKAGMDERLGHALNDCFDVVGLSIKSNTLTPSIEIANKCRQIKKDIIMAAGGPEVTVEGPGFLSENPVFDYAFLSEAEDSLLKFLQFLNGPGAVEAVSGLCYKMDGRVVSNPICVPDDLDKIPFPDYSVFDTFGKQTFYYPLVTSRGCPYDCTYCSVKVVSGKRFRARSASNVVSELEQFKKNYGLDDFVVLDDTFTQKIDRAKEICRELLKRNISATWHCYNGIRADRLDGELLDLMKESGCRDIWFGLETLDPDVFNLIKKGEHIEDIVKAIEMTKAKNINVSCFFIIGLPGSTYARDIETLKKARKLGIRNTHWSLATPMPGTALWDWVRENGRVLRDYRTLSFFKEPQCAFETDDYTEKERLKMFYKANLGFYGYRDLTSEKGLLKGGWKVLILILRYDAPRLPQHLFAAAKKLMSRLIG